MVDVSFIRHNYAAMADGQLIALAKKDGNELTREAFTVLKEEFVKRNLDLTIITAAENARKLKLGADIVKMRGGRGNDIIKQLWDYAFIEKKNNKTLQEIYDGLLERGADENLALTIAEGIETKAADLVTSSRHKIETGAVSFAVGAAVTIFTFVNAANGGVYIIAYGGIVFGIARFASGIIGIGSYKKILQNCINERELAEAAQQTDNDEY